MTGRSFFALLTGTQRFGTRQVVFLERERHANVRAGDAGYPMRAVRTREFLYIRNFRPERWPAGDPEPHRDPASPFGDCDDGPTKHFIRENRNHPELQSYFQLCFGKRPAEELYLPAQDPSQTNNLADQPAYSTAQTELRARLDRWMKATDDPRAVRDEDPWDTYPYYGGAARRAK
jgi:hypothetical protein